MFCLIIRDKGQVVSFIPFSDVEALERNVRENVNKIISEMLEEVQRTPENKFDYPLSEFGLQFEIVQMPKNGVQYSSENYERICQEAEEEEKRYMSEIFGYQEDEEFEG